MKLFSFSCATVAWTISQAAPLEDLVEELPLYGRPPTPHWSGYLDASDGCDTERNGACKLHYWLAMAEGDDPLSKPLVLWLNGGPGSSSILGFLQENGPLLINATGGLHENPYSWTKLVNLLALEAPVGVGYSYCDNQKQGRVCQNTDKFTASATAAALTDFFQNKFPEFSANHFFITGESYAGVYIPTLTREILDHSNINLQGIAVGDPCTDNKAQRDSMDSLWYGHKYGLVDDDIYDLLWNHCDARAPNLMTRGGKHLVAANLNLLLEENPHPGQVFESQFRGPLKDTPQCRLAWRKFMMSSSHALSQGWRDLYIDDYSLFSPVTTKEDVDMAIYMNLPAVRKALHVQDAPTKSWPSGDIGFNYTKEYDACNDNVLDDKSMIDFYRKIVPKLRITFIYNGDTDPCVSYEGTRKAVKQIGFDELDGGSYRPWFYNQTAATLKLLVEKAPLFGPGLLVQDMGAQMGGEVVDYEHGLSFLTVHGSGHMIPQFKPIAALHMLDKLIHFERLSPLLPTNATLTTMSMQDFGKAMDDWTESAQKPPYVKDVMRKESINTDVK